MSRDRLSTLLDQKRSGELLATDLTEQDKERMIGISASAEAGNGHIDMYTSVEENDGGGGEEKTEIDFGDEQDIDLDLVEQFDTAFNMFVAQNPNFLIHSPDAVHNWRITKLQSLLQAKIELETELRLQYDAIKEAKQSRAAELHKSLLTATKLKAERQTQLQSVLNMLQHQRQEMEETMKWKIFNLNVERTKKEEEMKKRREEEMRRREEEMRRREEEIRRQRALEESERIRQEVMAMERARQQEEMLAQEEAMYQQQLQQQQLQEQQQLQQQQLQQQQLQQQQLQQQQLQQQQLQQQQLQQQQRRVHFDLGEDDEWVQQNVFEAIQQKEVAAESLEDEVREFQMENTLLATQVEMLKRQLLEREKQTQKYERMEYLLQNMSDDDLLSMMHERRKVTRFAPEY